MHTVWIGAVIVVLAFVLIGKQFDSRMCLFLAGFLMCIVSGQFLAPFDKFLSSLFTGSIPQAIASAMGYAYLMGYTKCDYHLSVWLVGLLKKAAAFVIPGVILATGFVIFALSSNAGTAAAVGPVFIPVMIKAGVHPAMAASALALGGSGSYLTFANPHHIMVADIAKVDLSYVVLKVSYPAAIASYLIMIVWAFFYAKWKKENTGYVDPTGEFFEEDTTGFKINPYKAFLPFLPVLMVLLGVFGVFPKFSVPQAMLVGTVVALLTLRPNMGEAIKATTNGYGRALADVVSIIACAGVFTLGMEKIGLTPAMTNAMKSNPAIAVWGAGIGTWIIASLCGSGDAATLAFNGSITPLVGSFGMDPAKIGTIAHLCACFGRTMSPLAGISIICAGIAKVNPIEITKRTVAPAILSVLACILLLGYIL